MKSFARWIAQRIFSDYSAYSIYVAPDSLRKAPELPAHLALLPVDDALAHAITTHHDYSIRRLARYADRTTLGFALVRNGAIVSVAFYAGRDAYVGDAIWKLSEEDAALVEIATAETARGEALAPLLIQLSEQIMREAGKRRLIAWIWWSHAASRRAFSKAGWRVGGFTVSLKIRGLRRCVVWRKIRQQDP